jgi:hypothetical protein
MRSATNELIRSLTPVVCVIDHLYRDLDVADAACRGEFMHNGVTLALGATPDWINDGLATDEEWRIEWVKLYEGLDLAHAYETTGEARYLDTWVNLVRSFCAQVPVGHEPSEVSARRIQNWLYAWQRIEAAPPFAGLPDALADQLAERLIADVEHVRTHLTAERNHRTLELYAIFVAALALPNLDDRDSLVCESLALLIDNLLVDVWPDGVHRECSTDYHCIVVRSFIGVVANAQRFALTLPELFFERLHRALDFMMHAQRPDGSMPSFSDGDVGDFQILLEQAGTLLHRDDLIWVGSAGASGVAPVSFDATFSTGGYVIQRSGWGVDSTSPATSYANERWLMLDCGPIGDGGHGHYDQLSVEIAAAGRSIVVDPGRYTYAAEGHEPSGWRHWFKGTEAHNTVTVDSLDQTPYRRGKPKGPTSTARLVERSSSAQLDLIVAEVRSPQYSAVHTRRVAFIGREYWLIHDQLREASGAKHDYSLRWHLGAGTDLQRDLVVAKRPTVASVVSIVSVVSVASTDFTMVVGARDCGEFTVDIEPGWVSPTYGTKHAAPVVAARSHGSNVDFVTVIVPSESANQVALTSTFSDNGIEATILRQLPSGELIEDHLLWDSSATWTRTQL